MNVESTLQERGNRYGEFAQHAEIAQALQGVMRRAPGWVRLAADQAQALSVIADKIARILNGDPDYLDNWHDVQGYARLVEQRLLKLKTGAQTQATAPEIAMALVEDHPECIVANAAAAMLVAQDAELSSIGAGGVEPVLRAKPGVPDAS